MKIITESEVEKHLTLRDCINIMEQVMISVSERKTTLPIRQFMPIENTNGKMAIMPGSIPNPFCFGIKLVCKYVREKNSPHGSHVGMVLLFDSDQGVPLAMIEGASLTSIRTASVSALATKYMSKKEIKSISVLGCGEQAKRHILSMLTVRKAENIYIWGRDFEKAQLFSNKMKSKYNISVKPLYNAEEAVRNSDLICTTTSSSEPVIKGDWVQPGTHINLVGAAVPTSAEADEILLKKSRFITDYRPAALAAAGELLRAIDNKIVTEDHIVAEIGEVASGKIKGRNNNNEITIYKSLGVTAQDLGAAHFLYTKSQKEDFGTFINMMDYEEQS